MQEKVDGDSKVKTGLEDDKELTYSEQDGKREDNFSKAIKAIALVVRSEVCRLIAISATSTASDSVTCSAKCK